MQSGTRTDTSVAILFLIGRGPHIRLSPTASPPNEAIPTTRVSLLAWASAHGLHLHTGGRLQHREGNWAHAAETTNTVCAEHSCCTKMSGWMPQALRPDAYLLCCSLLPSLPQGVSTLHGDHGAREHELVQCAWMQITVGWPAARHGCNADRVPRAASKRRGQCLPTDEQLDASTASCMTLSNCCLRDREPR